MTGTVTRLLAGAHPALECRGVSVERGGNRVVTGVDLVVEEGDWVAIVGPNGAGKTSLLHAVAGLIPATGELRVGGLDPGNAPRRQVARVVALMPQRPVVPEGTTVRELVALGRTAHLRRFGTETAADRDAVERTLHRLELDRLADRPALGLSGGELQRVVLGRALAQEPRVLLLDEPTSALDIGHQQSVLDLVDTMRLQDELTVVAAMHDLTLAGQYGRRVVLMDQGRVVADASPSEVLRPVRLADVYGARVEVLQRDTGPAVLPVPADTTPGGSPDPLSRRTLVLGGARSGKSRHAQRLLADCPQVLYVAPGPVPDDTDSDWAARVAAHRRSRPEGWSTLETDDVPDAIETATRPVLVDCLATWLAGVMGTAGAWESADGDTAWHETVDLEVERLLKAWQSASVPVVAVSNEVGSGVVPGTRSGVLFRDALGRLNRQVADLTDDVRLVVAGRVQLLEDERV
ncbi:MAG TPA: bifunctional adenosylcobinamide kinase/adenosylcobinamide-phosphate guanylyltransferase [Nocardioides sp.]|nr:bifunctional adenosylcobinamide kinase/adenosylcobinamide-phosphate guanylyltransferase [Nocardioides sp.]